MVVERGGYDDGSEVQDNTELCWTGFVVQESSLGRGRSGVNPWSRYKFVE